MECCLQLRNKYDNDLYNMDDEEMQDVISGPKFCPTKIKALTNENARETLPRDVFSGKLIKCTVMRIWSQAVNRRFFL